MGATFKKSGRGEGGSSLRVMGGAPHGKRGGYPPICTGNGGRERRALRRKVQNGQGGRYPHPPWVQGVGGGYTLSPEHGGEGVT